MLIIVNSSFCIFRFRSQTFPTITQYFKIKLESTAIPESYIQYEKLELFQWEKVLK